MKSIKARLSITVAVLLIMIKLCYRSMLWGVKVVNSGACYTEGYYRCTLIKLHVITRNDQVVFAAGFSGSRLSRQVVILCCVL